MNYADEVCLNYVSTWHDERQALDMRAWHQKGPSLAPVRGKDGKDGKDSNCLHRHVMTPVIYMQKTAKGQGVEHTWTHIWYINLRHSFTSFAKYIYIYYNKYFNSSVNSLLWCKHHSTDSPKRLQMTLLPTTMKCYSKYDHDWLCMYGMVFERLDSELKCGILRWLNTYIFFTARHFWSKGTAFLDCKRVCRFGLWSCSGTYILTGATGVLPCFSRFKAQWDSKIFIDIPRYSGPYMATYSDLGHPNKRHPTSYLH